MQLYKNKATSSEKPKTPMALLIHKGDMMCSSWEPLNPDTVKHQVMDERITYDTIEAAA